MQISENLQLEVPSLPKGGGAITGLKGNIATLGPDGAATLTLPLPISLGRGYSPTLTLSYHSRAGNGIFGIGWNIHLPTIRRHTLYGVPNYDESDLFIGPDGEILAPILTEDGFPKTRQTNTLLGAILKDDFTVSTYRSRAETDFSKLEYWQTEGQNEPNFWVLYHSDGQVSLLGRNAQARVSHPITLTETAIWLLESSVSQTGEQIYYQYRTEDEIHCNTAEKQQHPNAVSQRYLTAAWYGNKKAARTLPAITTTPLISDWLFSVIFDFGERHTYITKEPDWLEPNKGDWLCRTDRFSTYEYGFNLRTRRLCHQILMYHAISELEGKFPPTNPLSLVSRLLLSYNEEPSITTLESVVQVAYEPDGSPCSLPPLTFDWQAFSTTTAQWQLRQDIGKLAPQPSFQVVALNGEGIAGILYKDNHGWWYRPPIRKIDNNPDAITWGNAILLSSIPSLLEKSSLIDLNGDGYLEWLVTQSGLSGYYERTPDGKWRPFTPLSALPIEFTHPRAQLTDLIGAGKTDLMLIGPKSVRLYAGKGDGWAQAQTTLQTESILPTYAVNENVLIAFSDIAGSGQQHLVEIRAGGVRYWANLGHGRFSPPISLAGFSQPLATFNPNQVYLADIDGSGTTDIIYALTDKLRIYRNQSGNQFAAPFDIPLPEGVNYDRTCHIQLADIQGLGVASMLFTVPHPTPRSWLCYLSTEKPYLLNNINNNMGGRHLLHYRSSAQFWLDEKAQAVATGAPTPFCYLPFPLHLLQRKEIIDDITGNHLVSDIRYRHGAWDGQEGEFRGFGFIEINDTDTLTSRGTADKITMPSIERRWYATGFSTIDSCLSKEYWQGDNTAFKQFEPRFTIGFADNEQTYEPENSQRFWLERALKGQLLRSEIFGVDDSAQATIPYTITEYRPQVRIVEERGTYPITWTTTAENRTYHYERISSDPQCQQQILLSSNEYGLPLRQINIHYPRRPKPTKSPYPDILPDTLFSSTYDNQQQVLRLTLSQNSWHQLEQSYHGIWQLGIANASRSDIYQHTASAVPDSGLTLELLNGSNSLIGDHLPYTFAGQQQIWYQGTQEKPTTECPVFPSRVSFTETAILDEDIVAQLAKSISVEQLTQAGYNQSAYFFERSSEANKNLWSARTQHVTYAQAEHFWLPISTRNTLLTGSNTLTRDKNDCVITQFTDPAGLSTSAEYDWRFLIPINLTDANDNKHLATLDALGRVTSTRFFGTEQGGMTGYSNTSMDPPNTLDQALALSAPLPVHQCIVYASNCWMKPLPEKLPPHILILTTDRYDNDSEQQIRQQVSFNDGFARTLQVANRQTSGTSWHRKENGSLAMDANGDLITQYTDFRWAISGRTEYDNKGHAIRTYQPYFLDDWKYVSDDSARQDLFADTHYYDPIGREWQVKTAKGWLRRSFFTPWFIIDEDENDTA